MKIIKVGMIGAGAIAKYHCAGIKTHPQGEVVAVADSSAKRAQAIKKEFGLARTYSSAEDLIADPELDAVIVALPNIYHAPVSIAALKSGKHVLCEKPFAMNRKEAARMIQTAKKKRKVLMVGMNWRYRQDTQTLKALIERGELGEIYHGKARLLRRSGIPKFGTWFCRKKISGGGAMLDIGVHMLDCCLYLMDNFKPVAVSGATYTKFGNRGLGEGGWGLSDQGQHVFDVDDFATALIKMRNGATVQLDISWALHQKDANLSNVHLYGTKAGAGLLPPELYRYPKKPGKYEVVKPRKVKFPPSKLDRGYNWIDVIVRKGKPLCTLTQALTVQKILDAIYASGKTGKEVRIK